MQLSAEKSPVARAVSAADVGALRLALREVLTQHHGNIPEELKALPAWVCWAVTKIESSGKFNKVPYYPNGSVRRGEQGSPQDRKQLGVFAEAYAEFNRNPGKYAGVGLAMLPDWGLVAFDADRCINNGRIRQDVQILTGGTYCELSPSETGVRAFWRGTAANGKNPDKGFELYSAKQFVTVTGNGVPNIYTLIGGEIPKLTTHQRQELETVCKSQTAKGAISKTAKLNEAALHDPIYRRLDKLGMIERDMGGGKFSILCPFEAGHSDYGRAGGDGDTAYFLPHTDGYAQGHFHCTHASCSERKDSDFLRAIGFYDADFDHLDSGELLADEGSDPFPDALLQHPTQDNVALLFRRKLKDRLVYAHQVGAWFEWDGMRWRRETTSKAFDFARSIARKVNREGKTSPSTAAFCNGVEAFARADRAFARTGEEFDKDSYLLNTTAGTFDLRTHVMRDHDPIDQITKITSVAPTPEGGQRFRLFLDEITGEDKELIRFLKVSLGACLSGAIESHWLLFWTGGGRNGKNTLGDLVMHVIGDYGRKIPAATLMAKTHEAHPTEIASLQGVRLATSSEVSEGAHWNEARINELTGDKEISARFMRGDFFEFPRTHKHLIYGNHRPRLMSITPALKARIKIVPFTQSFIGREDSNLPAQLLTEAGFVLYWLLEGHKEWLEAGRKLPECEAVERESADYFDSQSTTEAWIDERLTKLEPDERPGRSCPKASELYQDYEMWKRCRGESPVSQTRWAESMRRFEKFQGAGVRYRGVMLNPECADFDSLSA